MYLQKKCHIPKMSENNKKHDDKSAYACLILCLAFLVVFTPFPCSKKHTWLVVKNTSHIILKYKALILK